MSCMKAALIIILPPPSISVLTQYSLRLQREREYSRIQELDQDPGPSCERSMNNRVLRRFVWRTDPLAKRGLTWQSTRGHIDLGGLDDRRRGTKSDSMGKGRRKSSPEIERGAVTPGANPPSLSANNEWEGCKVQWEKWMKWS
ncbi:hypothetical protein CPB86DRAFT_823486 [Serendipita vermifera]|nr:hypothetical protein CPB86DRAFT_823486 [Serendipita vermifera]